MYQQNLFKLWIWVQPTKDGKQQGDARFVDLQIVGGISSHNMTKNFFPSYF
jgi:hypothetical protein